MGKNKGEVQERRAKRVERENEVRRRLNAWAGARRGVMDLATATDEDYNNVKRWLEDRSATLPLGFLLALLEAYSGELSAEWLLTGRREEGQRAQEAIQKLEGVLRELKIVGEVKGGDQP